MIDTGKATTTFTNFTKKAGSALKLLGAALSSMAINFLIVKGIEMFVGLLDSLIVTAKEARESSEALTKAMSDFRNEVRDGNKVLSSVSERYEELRKGVDSLGRNVSLTNKTAEQIP